ncbi:MAG: hypothetical protein WBD07_17235 [Vicinamibacterales bacterium]
MFLSVARPLTWLVLIVTLGPPNVTAQTTGSEKKRLLLSGAAIVGGGIGLAALGFGEECTTKQASTTCEARSAATGVGGLMVATVGSVLLAKGVLRSTTLFADLSSRIKVDDAVSILGTDGRRTRGKVAELTPSSLTLLVNGSERQTFPEATVRRIVVRDSVWDGLRNGASLGLLAGGITGAVLGGPLVVGLCELNERPGHTCPNSVAGALLFGALGAGAGAGIGAGIGVAIDASVSRTIDMSRVQGAHLTVSPVISTDRWAVLASIRF